MEINEKTKKYHTIITVPQSIEQNLQKEAKLIPQTHKKGY